MNHSIDLFPQGCIVYEHISQHFPQLMEVLMLSLLHHPNLVNLIGYCVDGDQRLLVFEFMSLGLLEDHLHG